MADKQDTTVYFTDDENFIQRFSAKLKKVLHTFFDIFYIQYKSSDFQVRQYSKQRQKIYHTFNMILYSLQLVSLVFPPITPGWTSFSLFSDSLNSVRGDYILVKIGLGMPCYFFAIGITSIIFASLLILFVKSLKKLPYDIQNYKLTLTNGLSFIKNFSFIPFLCIFSAVQKYEIVGNVDEYGNGTQIQLPVPYLGLISLIFAVILVFLALVENTFQYQQFLNKKSSSIFSRAHSKIETLKIFLSTTLIYSYFYLKSIQNSVHLLIALLIGLCQWYLYTFYLPFYHLYTNFTHSTAYLLLFWVSFVQLLAVVLPNSSMVFLLITIISPCLITIQWSLLKNRKESIQGKFEGLLEIENIYQCELLIRSYSEQFLKMKKKTDKVHLEQIKQNIFRVFKFMRKQFNRCNMLAVWEFIFAYTLMQDEGLSRIKLSGTSSVFDIEGSYLYYKYSKFIDDFSIEYLEEVDFVRFRRYYEQAKKQDKKTCFLQFEFWKELSLEKPNTENLQKIAYKLHDNLKKSKKILKKVYLQYPNNQLILKLYGSFLLEVYNDTAKGYDFLSKGEHEKHQLEQKSKNLDKFNYFDDSNGILIISGQKDTIGNIVSINNPACEIFKISQNFAINSNISAYLPPPMNNKRIHNTAMLRFIEISSTTSVSSHPFHNFFLDSFGFLIEVYMQIRCVALNDSLFFLVGVRKKMNSREVILYENDSILANTRGFAQLINLSDSETNLKSISLSSVIKGFSSHLKAKETSEVFEYVIPNTSKIVTFKFLDIEIRDSQFKYLIASDDIEEIELWNKEQAESFNELLMKTVNIIEPAPVSATKGILRMSQEKKGLSVKFDLRPNFFYITETDFKPGKAATGKVKDVITNEFKGKKKDKVAEDPQVKFEVIQNEEPVGEIMDLGDIHEDFIKLNSERSDHGSEGQADEKVVKKSGTSIASSGQSSNASFTASVEAQTLLTGVTTSMKSFKVAFFLTIIIVNIAVIAMIIYLKLISNSYIDSIIIKELSDRRVLMANLTLSARNLELLHYNQGFYAEADMKRLMAQDIDSYLSIISKIEEKLPDWDQKTKSLYKSNNVKTWDLINNELQSSDYNLMDVMKVFVARADKLQLTKLSLMSYDNPDFYYIYRNGLSESFSAVNSSIMSFTVEQEKITENILLIVLLLALAAIILMILCFVAVLIPTLWSVERSNGTVWRLFYLLPLDLVQEMRSRCEDRLDMTHGIEPEAQDESSKFKNIKTRRLIKPKKKFLAILLRISLYYLLSMALFIFFYYFAYKNFGEQLKLKPKILNLSGLRAVYTDVLYFWLQECQYKNTSNSYIYITPENRYNIDPAQELEKVILELLHVEMELVYSTYKGLGQSAEHKNLIFEQACWNTNCELLANGLHSGILVYTNEIANAKNLIESGNWVDLESIYNMKNELQYGDQKLFNMYEQFMTDNINYYITTVIYVTSSYCVIVLALYLLVYIPIINSVREEITKIWKLGRLIPIEHRNKIMTAFKQASGKIKY